MKYPKLTAASVLVVVALTTIAATPGAPHRFFVRMPRSFVRQFESIPIRMEWRRLEERVYQGDAEAMYRVGMEMLRRGDWRRYGPAADSIQGEVLIRDAAALGYMPAQVKQWQLDRGSAEELYRLLPEEWDSEWEGNVHMLSAAYEECHDALYRRGVSIWGQIMTKYNLERTDQTDLERADFDRFRLLWDARFEQQCGFSPSPAD